MNVSNINERLAICEQCPIYNKAKGLCNPALWINPKTNRTSPVFQNGYIRGCGCFVKVKAKNPNNHCIAGKW